MTMTLVDVVTMVGDILTDVDVMLANSNLPSTDPDWQQLFALRIHLDTLQQQLVKLQLDLDTDQFKKLTDKLNDANTELAKKIEVLKKVSVTFKTIAQVAALVDQIIALAAV
jgi:hypothetical protein